MLRVGKLGHFRFRKKGTKHIQTLSSAALAREAGLMKVIGALAAYRGAACMSGLVKVSPKLVCDHDEATCVRETNCNAGNLRILSPVFRWSPGRGLPQLRVRWKL